MTEQTMWWLGASIEAVLLAGVVALFQGASAGGPRRAMLAPRSREEPRMARVFVIQDNGTRDFTAAKRYGALVPMVERDVFPDDSEERVTTITHIMKAKLSSFNPLVDFLLLTGDPVAILVAGGVLASMGIIEYQALKWDRENRGYYSVAIEL